MVPQTVSNYMIQDVINQLKGLFNAKAKACRPLKQITAVLTKMNHFY